MKRITKHGYLFVMGSIMLLIIDSSCHKHNVGNVGCGCNSDSVWRYATYDNFGGFNYTALLNYNTDNNQNAWFIGVRVPNANYSAILKICNPESKVVKAFTDTSSRKYPIPVVFTGSLKNYVLMRIKLLDM